MSISNGVLVNEGRDVDLLHEIGSRIAAADPLHEVLGRVVEFISAVAKFDSCFVYVLEDNVLQASRIRMPRWSEAASGPRHHRMGAEHKRPIAISYDASRIRAIFQRFTRRSPSFPSVPVLSATNSSW
jgi:uroporphyrinogen-III synthase